MHEEVGALDRIASNAKARLCVSRGNEMAMWYLVSSSETPDDKRNPRNFA